METARPKLKIPLTAADKVVETICWLGLLAMWLAAFYLYQTLPEIIPTHINGSGKVDGYGSKNTIWLLPAIASVLVMGLSWLNRFPHTFNYLEEITAANAERQYRNATRIMRFMKLFLVLLFGSILLVAGNASEPTGKAAAWAVPLIISVAVLLPVFMVIYMYAQNRPEQNKTT